MAHEVENMFYMGAVPWHGLGVKLDQPPTVEEALEFSGLNWTVEKKPLVIQGTNTLVPSYATTRTIKGKESVLGVVGNRYTVLQNRDAFNWFQPFLDSGEVELHTAGSLREGRHVWILAKILHSSQEIVPGDAIEHFVMLSSSHDGSTPIRAGLTATRVVCANTLAAAHNAASSKLLRVRHTATAQISLDLVRESLDVARREFRATTDNMRKMAQFGVSEADLMQYVCEIFEPESEDAASKLYDKVVPLFENGRGSKVQGVKGTLWGAYNAVTEFLTWERGRTQDTRLESLWFGQAAELGQRAYDTALLLAA